MLPEEVITQIKKLEIQTRKIVNSLFAGEYHSVFKGRGLNFAEVRAYQPGDDVRLIDWKVTAKLGTPYVKLFEEERELVVFLLVDISASNNFGSVNKTKRQVIAELASIIGFSAAKNNDRVGLLLFSDQVEHYLPPKKGQKHIYRVLRDILNIQPVHKKTKINSALDYLLKIYKKKAIVFLISDFIDTNYEQKLKIVAKKHDLIPIIIADPREEQLPVVGKIVFQNPENGETLVFDSHATDAIENYANIIHSDNLSRKRFFASLLINPIEIDISKNYLKPLELYFRKRKTKY